MKKLLLILTAVFVSAIGWAQNNADAPYLLNPYAYDLTSSWDEATQKLTVNFKVNSAPNLHDTRDANNNAVNGRGIQVFLVDSKGNEYYICGPSQDDIRKAHKATGGRYGSYSYTIDLTSGLDRNGKLIPRNEDLTWKVRVNGRKNYNAEIANGLGGSQNFSKPRRWLIENNPAYQKRFISHSIDVVTNPQAPNFGRIMITDGIKVSTDNGWGNAHDDRYYSYTEGRGLYILEPDFVNFANNGKRAALNSNKNGGFVDPLEPREVCVSDNGRIFVSSASKTSATAVWELSSNYKTWKEILTKSTLGNRRVVAMDTKGAGDAITLLLLCAPKDANTPLTCWEYNLQNRTLTEVDLPTNVTDITPYVEGINFQAKVQYASNGDIWVGLGNTYGSRVVRVKDNTYRFYGSNSSGSWGGEAFVIKDNLMIKSSRTSGDADILFKRLDNGNNYFSDNIDAEGIGMDAWITDFAIDYADNVFVASNYHGRVIPISMPYDGVRYTPAPSNQKFTLSDPVPNILATDLRYDIVRGKNQYEFSFNVNTKPQEAQIRFYESYEDMQKSLNVVNADNYDGTNTNKPVYVYNIPQDKLKQGRIAVNLGAVGGQADANGVITNDRLPAGVLYWSVYVKTRESKVFAPIYEQSTTGEDAHHRLHATVNNYPETDGFGHIYAVNYYAEFDSRNGLMEYSSNPTGESNDEQNSIKNSTRYKLVKNYLNPAGNKPKFTNQRRLAVAPDGKVYIADCGSSLPFDKNAIRPWLFTGGGVFVWNPNTQTGNEIQISLFSTKDQSSTATAVDIYNHDGQLKLYATNTYGEFENHYSGKKYWKDYQYTEDNQANVNIYGWNGFKEFNLGTPNNILLEETTGTVLHSLGMGDGNGNIGIVATDKGIWLAQHRLNDVQYTIDQFKANNATKPALPDNTENYILSFVPYNSNTRMWKSCTTRGINYSGSQYDQTGASELTQLPSSPLQACPGAGLAYRKTNGKEFLYIVNHQGNIVELQITSWSGTTPSVQYTKTYPGAGPKAVFQNTGRLQGIINTMCFDYAGNLITTSGLEYLGSTSTQNIIVYTMPYDRVNAREIQAPNSCRMIPERIAHLDMDKEDLDDLIEEHQKDHPTGCAVDLYRPIQGGEFNTICLPCTLDLKTLPEGHPLYKAELKEYTGLNLNTVGGEKVLELVFTDVSNRVIIANKPYIIQPEENYNSIIRFAGPLRLTNTTGEYITCSDTEDDKTYSITFQGIIPYQEITPIVQDGVSLTLMLVADNRLAEMTTKGYMYGFRGCFELNQPLPKGMRTRITTSKGTATNTTIVVDGKKVNVEKFIREGRVCIRVGETLYTIDGEVIGR